MLDSGHGDHGSGTNVRVSGLAVCAGEASSDIGLGVSDFGDGTCRVQGSKNGTVIDSNCERNLFGGVICGSWVAFLELEVSNVVGAAYQSANFSKWLTNIGLNNISVVGRFC